MPPAKGTGTWSLLARAFQSSVPFRSWKRLIARRLPPLAARSLPTDQNILPTMRDEERYSSSRPLKEFHGNEEDYPDWETDFETWCVRRGFDRHLEMQDPRERDRVWASYTVSRLDDPNGPIGARIHRETHDVYAQKCEMYKDKDKKLWAEVQEAMKGDAKTFVQQGPKYEGKKNVQRIKEKYGKSSAAKMCVRIVKFVMMKKKQGTSIETHNTDWGKECRQLFKPPMVLPPMLQCCLYLLSLGPEYKQFQTIAALGSDEDFIVERLMRKAVLCAIRPADRGGVTGPALSGTLAAT